MTSTAIAVRSIVRRASAEHGDMVDFDGSALQLPGVAFKAILTRVSD